MKPSDVESTAADAAARRYVLNGSAGVTMADTTHDIPFTATNPALPITKSPRPSTSGTGVKIRLDNSAGSDHQMHHPFHVHGAGRFLVLDRGGVPEPNLVWKDTVLVRAGKVVHILFEVTNPGRRMAHCRIAEHIETGMMFSFDVLEPTAAGETTP